MSESQGFQIKYLLASMAFQNPARFASTFRGEEGEAYLRSLWDGLGQQITMDRRVPSDGTSVAVLGEILVLRLPPPREANDAHAVAVVDRGVAGPRVFFLEKAEIPTLPHVRAMIAEVTPDTRRNCGPLDDTGNTSFVERIRTLLA